MQLVYIELLNIKLNKAYMLNQYENLLIYLRAEVAIYKKHGWIGKFLPNMLNIITTIVKYDKPMSPPP